MIIVTVILVLALLIGANALYVAAEFGAVSVRRSKLRSLAEDGNARAARLLAHVGEPGALDRYVAACQVGITLSSLVLGAYAQSELAPLIGEAFGLGAGGAHSVAAVILLAVLSVMQMILGELVPKGLALQFPDRTALYTVAPMRWSLRLFRPLIWLFNGSGMAILRLLGVRPTSGHHVHNPKEIEILLAEAAAGGLAPEERRRLRRALHLSSRSAHELMVPRHRVVAFDVDQPLEEIVEQISNDRYSRFPVYEGSLDNPIGTLHAKDAVVGLVGGGQRTLRSMLRPVVTVSPAAPADDILFHMRAKRVQQALVVDSAGRVAGVVTLTDVLGELFGALADEFKHGGTLRPATRRPLTQEGRP